MNKSTAILSAVVIALVVIVAAVFASGVLDKKDSEECDPLVGTWYMTQYSFYNDDISDGEIVTSTYTMDEKHYPFVIETVDDGMFKGTIRDVTVAGGVQGPRIIFSYYDASTGFETTCNGVLVETLEGKTYNALYLTILQSKIGNEHNAIHAVMFKESSEAIYQPEEDHFPDVLEGVSNSITTSKGTVIPAENITLNKISSENGVVILRGNYGNEAIEYVLVMDGINKSGALLGSGLTYFNGKTWICNIVISDGKTYMDYICGHDISMIGHAEFTEDWLYGSYEDLPDLAAKYQIDVEKKTIDGHSIKILPSTVTNVMKVGNTVYMTCDSGAEMIVYISDTYNGMKVNITIANENELCTLVGYLDSNGEINASGTSLYNGQSTAMTIKMVPIDG